MSYEDWKNRPRYSSADLEHAKKGVRDAALDEAAKVAEKRDPSRLKNMIGERLHREGVQIAEAIRALKEKTNEGT